MGTTITEICIVVPLRKLKHITILRLYTLLLGAYFKNYKSSQHTTEILKCTSLLLCSKQAHYRANLDAYQQRSG